MPSVEKKKQIVLRLSNKLWNEINALADNEFRSFNGQIEYILTEAVKNKKTRGELGKEQLSKL